MINPKKDKKNNISLDENNEGKPNDKDKPKKKLDKKIDDIDDNKKESSEGKSKK